MKKFKLFFAAFLLLFLITSCKKDTTDNHAKFIGTYTGPINSIVPGLNSKLKYNYSTLWELCEKP